MVYHSTFKKKIMPFATTRMNLEDSRLSEIRCRCRTQKKEEKKTNPACPLLHVESIKVKYTETESRMVVNKGRGLGKQGDVEVHKVEVLWAE